MTTAFVLLMLWGGSTTQSGIGIVQQEFTTFESCEVARKALATAHERSSGMSIRAQGCFKK